MNSETRILREELRRRCVEFPESYTVNNGQIYYLGQLVTGPVNRPQVDSAIRKAKERIDNQEGV